MCVFDMPPDGSLHLMKTNEVAETKCTNKEKEYMYQANTL